MAFTWKFAKPVSKATLTANGYSFPSGTTDPTEDILKAQLMEIRSYIDSVESLVRCSSNNSTVYSDRYSVTCSAHNSSYGTCGTHYTSKNSTISCSTTYSTRYNSKYGTRYNAKCNTVYKADGSCTAENFVLCTSQYPSNYAGNVKSEYSMNFGTLYSNNDKSDLNGDNTADQGAYKASYQSTYESKNRSGYNSTDYNGNNTINRWGDDSAEHVSVNTSVNSSHCSGQGS